MRFTTTDTAVEYTPEYEGNRRAPSPATFKLLPLNAGDLRAHRLRVARAVELGRNEEVRSELERILIDGIQEVSGIMLRRITDDGASVAETPIQSASEFVKHAPEKLKTELYEAMTNPAKLDAGLEGLEGN